MKTIENLKLDSNFAIIEKDEQVSIFTGKTIELNSLGELEKLQKETRKKIVFIAPFCLARDEKGYEANGSEKIIAMEVENEINMTRHELLNILPNDIVNIGKRSVNISDEQFCEIVVNAKNDIENGEFNQLILSRKFLAEIEIIEENIFSIYNKLLKNRGQYMTYLFNTDREIFVGATPEKHLLIENGNVVMNPIAGTIKKGDFFDFYDRLLSFLIDEKEIGELAMVIDEELKMLSKITKSGTIDGPFIREVGAVFHTDVDLNGTIKDGISMTEALAKTLYAPTLVGGPLESVFKNIKNYEGDSRGYYGGVFGMLGEDFLDTAIVIRTAFIDKVNSILSVRAGAGIVKDSVPQNEAMETIHKSNGFFGSIIGTITANSMNYLSSLENYEMEKITELLDNRKQRLSNFYLNSHLKENMEVEKIKGKNFVLINNGDDFVYLSGFMIEKMGGNQKVVDNKDFDISKLKDDDIILLGPGYGDINDENDPKMIKLLNITKKLISKDVKVLGICLGHQAICKTMGYDILQQENITQGEQLDVVINGKVEKLGFYNSFSPVNNGKNQNVETFLDDRVLSYKNINISSTQAHPESIMSINGFEILKNMVLEIL